MSDQLLNTTRIGPDIAGQDHSQTPTDIKVTATIIHTEVIPDHITDTTTEVLDDTITPALIAIAVTCHTRDHPHVEVYHPIPEIIAGPDHTHCISPSKNTSSKSSSSSSRTTVKPQDRKQKRVMGDDPQSDYYSSDDISSDSEDDLS